MFLKQFYIKICKISSTTIRDVLYVLNNSAVWKLWKFTVTHLWQKFRENNVFTKEVTKQLI